MTAERRILYLDLIGGAAGDMLMAALVDAGAPLDRVCAAIDGLALDQLELHTVVTQSAGLRARQMDVMIRGVLADSEPHPHHHHAHDAVEDGAHDHHAHDHHAHDHAHHGHRPYAEVRERIGAAPGLSDRARAWALDAFRRLAEAEADVHGTTIEEVVFHEVGADDAMADVVGVATAVDLLNPHEIVVSPVPIARGLTRGAHGPIPLPGPAALRILLGAPLAETPLRGELVTPTGAALLAALATRFGPIPSMVVEAIGVGAGHKSWPDRPNVVRALLGRTAATTVLEVDEESVVAANLDDMHPQHVSSLEAALFAAGALDVWSAPIHMKKGRPGLEVSALGPSRLTAALSDAFFAHSTTLGVRITAVRRRRIERRVEEIETALGRVRVKIAPRALGPELVMPEHDDCERISRERGVPVRAVWEAALSAAWAKRRP